jgi:hypothetical protein
MLYFCERAYAPKTPDELAQWHRVLEFQRDLPCEQLAWRYESVSQFEALGREHLTRYLLTSFPALAPAPSANGGTPRAVQPAGGRGVVHPVARRSSTLSMTR